MTLAKAFEAEPQLPEIYEADEEVKALIDMARKLEGVTRNAGKHAGRGYRPDQNHRLCAALLRRSGPAPGHPVR